jgi:hypothetical protein
LLCRKVGSQLILSSPCYFLGALTGVLIFEIYIALCRSVLRSCADFAFSGAGSLDDYHPIYWFFLTLFGAFLLINFMMRSRIMKAQAIKLGEMI